MPRLRPLLTLILLLAATAGTLRESAAQEATRPSLGLGFNAVLSSTEGLGVGVRGRAAWPVNSDLSLGLGTGLTGFVLEGRDEATYLFDPQASVIVTLNGTGNRVPYFLGGVGAAVPINNKNNAESGPTLHFGMGWVQLLRETVLFYEVDPQMLVGQDEISFMIPFRIGVIF